MKTLEYIRKRQLNVVPCDYEWEDRGTWAWPHEQTYNALGGLFPRANLALATAAMEWIAARFEDHASPHLVHKLEQVIEAAWAAQVDRRYLRFGAADGSNEGSPMCQVLKSEHELEDPYKGPILRGMDLLAEAVNDTYSGYLRPDWKTVYITNLLRLVLGKKAGVWSTWRKRIWTQLVGSYHEPGDLSTWEPGPPVPRIATDPTTPFDSKQSDVLIDKFLQGLKPDENPFLCSRSELESLGFIGTPYQYPSG